VILLDTNVVSEVLRTHPDPHVLAWMASQPRASLFTTAVTQAEVLYGLRLLPEGRKRTTLEGVIDLVFREDLRDRVLPFDSGAAEAFADIAAERRRAGLPISQFDAQIAAIARSRGARLATRNVRDFDRCGVTVVNPWLA
jgi:hypothetical protein